MKSFSFWLFLCVMTTSLAFAQNDTPANEQLHSGALGSYSVSLNVSDLKASIAFYEKLGFDPVEGLGSPEQNWLILSNGAVNIGLFQGFFPSNTLTFNPTDARSIYRTVKNHGIQPVFEIGMDQESGPCSFSIVDPDGNPILIDQR